MSDFDRAFEEVVGIEGGLSMDPHDPGNWTGGKPGEGELKGTKYGISAEWHPDLDIANVTLEQAKAIYRLDYWHRAGCENLVWPMSLYVFDCAVNQGIGAAKVFLDASKGDPVAFLAERALRYARSDNFDRYGKGWFRRLFKIARA